ncbi:acyl-CoA dehydratase activase-related protein [Proteiniborus sp. MB09-C3]|uniref:acyl-CoA dehydratase activase-related protein n=1 Tax=Proteiniborus sp. MB09-C3 TaxID=3050072 RepID=UPI002556ECE8|nr:acyl-CoA dehydratase activase-related protein [Proteiniborus sp. MB09-C3]WIV11328.1 acyl-CoA dehydratase activase-related protein [Proteiniborus sp. MB09-C3]
MSFKVGIPQSLFFYDYFPLWKEFFNELGAEVVVSPKTNKFILNDGVSNCVDEACLPVKVYHGHVMSLRDKVDYLFIPKMISIQKREYGCPKYLGLPEMVQNSVDNLPNCIDLKVNLIKSNSGLIDAVEEAGKHITPNISKIKKAYKVASKHYENYRGLINKGVIPIEAIQIYNSATKAIRPINNNGPIFMLVGHPYNLYDEYINMNLIKKLWSNGIRVVTPEMIDTVKADYYSSMLPKRMFWSFGKRIIGSSFYMINEKKIDGIIYVSSFGCGVDSVLIDFVQREARKECIPFTLLTIDEHTGEAGINTRIEAFIDMIKRRSKNENNISTHG